MTVMEFTTGVEFDSRTCIGDLLENLKSPVISTSKAGHVNHLNTQRGIYVVHCLNKRDDTIFICDKTVDITSLRNDLYNSDFGYAVGEVDPTLWTSVDGGRWLSPWTCRPDDARVTEHRGGLVQSLCTSLGSRERLSRAILITPNEQLVRLRSGATGGRIILKKIIRSHKRMIYTLVDKCNDSKEIGYLIVCSRVENAKPPALHVVRDVDNRVFCIIIGDNITARFSSYNKEHVYKLFSHYEGKIYKSKYYKSNY
jgi:hypothetical protein